MASLIDLQNQLTKAEQGLSQYQDPNLTNQINNSVTEAYAPSIKSATGNVGQMMSDFLPQYFNIPFTGRTAGTTAADLTPQQKMASMSTQLGQM